MRPSDKSRIEQIESSPKDTLWGFTVVWLIGSVATLAAGWLAISGRLWDLGLRMWAINSILLVGVWQWLWVVPVLARARRRGRRGFCGGMLAGAVSFCIVNVSALLLLYFTVRHASLQ